MTRTSIACRLAACGASIAALTVACAVPEPSACRLTCGAQRSCPGGFVCQDSSDQCVPVGYSSPCPTSSASAGSPEAVGAGPAQNSLDGGSDADPIGAGTSTAEVIAEGNPPGPRFISGSRVLRLDSSLSSADTACTGRELVRTFTASGGSGSYSWEVTGEAPGLSSRVVGGSEFRIEGTPTAAGTLRVTLIDGGTEPVSETLVVHATPRISTTLLPAVCPGEVYSAPLLASGGDAGAYTWSAALAGEPSLPETLSDTGLAVRGAALEGHFQAPSGAAPLRLTLAVNDLHCRSAEETIELDVLPAGTAACPRVHLGNLGLPDEQELPPACLGVPYREQLLAEGGPDATWQQISAPPGLHFDPDTQIVSGVAEGDGTLIVRVSSAAHVIEQRLDLKPRSACWFGSVNSANTPATLDLLDARRLSFRFAGFEVIGARRSISGSASGEAVSDFQFSPDPSRLAYRLGADPASQRLVLVNLRTGVEAPLAPNATGYAWSSDGSRLAVTSTSDSGPVLDIFEPTATGARAALPQQPLYPGQAGSLAVRSAPVWFGSGAVALLLDDPVTAGLVVPGYLEARAATPGVVRLDEPRNAGVALRGGPDGFFVFDGNVRYFSPGRDRVEHAGVVISPSGRFVGRARDGVLRVFHAHQSASDNDPLLGGATSGCSRLLAWAVEKERVVCWSEEHGALMVYDLAELDAARLTLNALGAIAGSYQYPSVAAPPLRRVLSRTGRWFAFDTPDGAYLANLGDAAAPTLPRPLTAERVVGAASNDADERASLSFSPDERLLALHLARGELIVQSLDAGGPPLDLGDGDLGPPLACSESISDTGLDGCGAEPARGSIRWAPGSDLLVHESAAGTLQIHDLSQLRYDYSDDLWVNPSCEGSCFTDGAYGFQP